MDNDAQPGFFVANFVALENGGTATITVVRRGGSANAYSVQYATSDNTALAGANYVSTTGTLTWLDGDTTNKTFAVALIDNAVTNGPLLVNLTLANATNTTLGASVPLTNLATAILTILDNESGPGQIGFSVSTYTANEQDGSVTITVIRTNGASGAMAVNFSTLLTGTAVAGTH